MIRLTRPGLGRPLPLVLAGLAVATALPAAGGPASAAGMVATAGYEDRKLAVWNHDLEIGSDGVTPSYWSTQYSPSATSTSRAARAPSPSGNGSPFPTYTGDNNRNHVLRVYDASRSAGVQTWTRAVQAVAGRTYAADMQEYVSSGAGATITLEWLSTSGSRVGSLVAQANRVPTAGHAYYVRAKGVAPGGATAVRARIVSTYGAIGTSWWDTLSITQATPPQAVPRALGTGTVLFVGDERVRSMGGLTRYVVAGRKPATYPNGQQWLYDASTCSCNSYPSHTAQMFGTVLHRPGGAYQLWFTGKGIQSGDTWSTYYSSSSDGTSFPRARRVLSNVWAGGVVLNPDSSNAQRRYLLLGNRGTLVRPARPTSGPPDVSYRAFGSPDGVSWTALSSSPVLPMRDIAYVSYDAAAHRFLATSKQASGSGDRQVYTSTSTDFVHWTAPIQAVRADGTDPSGASIYGMAAFRYGEQLLGMPYLYRRDVAFAGGLGPVTPQIASSLDGVHWARPSRSPFIPLGAAGAPDDGFILTGNDLTPVDARTMRMYYGGWDAGHESPGRRPRLFYAEWTTDRFARLATTSTGSVTTKPLRFAGNSLTVNADLGSAGRLQVEVLDSSGALVPGYGITDSTIVTGDHLASAVTWGGKDLGSLAGRDVALRFTLTNGSLYAYRVS